MLNPYHLILKQILVVRLGLVMFRLSYLGSHFVHPKNMRNRRKCTDCKHFSHIFCEMIFMPFSWENGLEFAFRGYPIFERIILRDCSHDFISYFRKWDVLFPFPEIGNFFFLFPEIGNPHFRLNIFNNIDRLIPETTLTFFI